MDDDELPESLRQQLGVLRYEFDEEVRSLNVQRLSYADKFVEHALLIERSTLEHRVPAHRRPESVELLVLLCGTSPQPLLLSASFVKPRRVMLVGSSSVQGRDAMARVDQELRSVERKDGVVFERVESCEIAANDPTEAYRELAAEIRQRQTELKLKPAQILVDITGGKKTMVAAAFLVCSELGLRSAYVDAEYDERARMPRPGTANYVLLRDPVAAYRVRELREVVSLVRRARYAAATNLLSQLLEYDLTVPRANLEEALKRLRCLDAWSDRRMSEVKDAPGELGAFGVEWAKQSGRTGWSLNACAKVDAGRLLSRFALHRVAYAMRLARLGDRRATIDAFLVAFSACDALADGTLVVLLETKRVIYSGKKDPKSFIDQVGGKAATALLKEGVAPEGVTVDAAAWRGVGIETFDAALGHADLRKVRNDLMHGVREPDQERIERFFEQRAPERFIQSVEHALGRSDFDVEAERRRIDQAIDGLEREVIQLVGGEP